MTRSQMVLNLVAAGLGNASLVGAMAAIVAADPVGDDWVAFHDRLFLLYIAPDSKRRALLRAACRDFDIPVPGALEDDPHEQCTLF